jgi:hypothetical protein
MCAPRESAEVGQTCVCRRSASFIAFLSLQWTKGTNKIPIGGKRDEFHNSQRESKTCAVGTMMLVIASEAKQSRRLAMAVRPFWIASSLRSSQ